MECLACGYKGENFKLLEAPGLSDKEYQIAFCPNCGLGRTLNISLEDLNEVNEALYNNVEGRVRLYYSVLFHHLQVRYQETLRKIDKLKKGNRLLEVGSNIGFTLNLAKQHGYDAVGCEVNPRSRALSEALYGLRIEPDFFQIHQSFDVMIMNDVLEHFPDPSVALSKAHDLLNTEGILFVQLPNVGSKQFKRQQEKWEFLMPPDHTFHFTVKSLRLMAEKNGLRCSWHRTVNSVEDFGAIRMLSPGMREKILYTIHHNAWYWPRFYKAKNDQGSLIQMILSK